MICPRCGSADVTVEAIIESELKKKRMGVLWWLFIGWWWVPFKWIFLTLPALIVKIFKSEKYKVVNHVRTFAVCHSCGKSWECK